MLVAIPVLIGGACFAPARNTALPPTPSGPITSYVAVGSGETVGEGADVRLRDGWAQRFYRESLPRATQFVNVARPQLLASDAVSEALPEVLALSPTIVAVWLNTDDLLAGTEPETFGSALRQFLHGLRQSGRAQVLVANVAPLQAVASAPTAEYNTVIAEAADAEGAVLVNLAGAAIASDDGRYPNSAGHAAVASAFGAALRK